MAGHFVFLPFSGRLEGFARILGVSGWTRSRGRTERAKKGVYPSVVVRSLRRLVSTREFGWCSGQGRRRTDVRVAQREESIGKAVLCVSHRGVVKVTNNTKIQKDDVFKRLIDAEGLEMEREKARECSVLVCM